MKKKNQTNLEPLLRINDDVATSVTYVSQG